jgi:DNA-binding XRE family transcriptional regulator
VKSSKRKKLEHAGFKIGTVQNFLQLSGVDMALIDLKISLVELFKTARKSAGITQQQLAKLIGSSQSRVAKLEAASPDITLDLICKALFALGVSREKIGKTLASNKAA